MKKVIFIIGFMLVVLSGVYLYYNDTEVVGYSNDISDWVDDSTIDVVQVSLGQNNEQSGRLEWFVDGKQTVFGYKGYYNGVYFDKEFIAGDEGLRIGSDMNPNDGIIEGFIVERKIGEDLEVYIFVDEDWKRKMETTNIVYGVGYSQEKEFSFNEVGDGVYMDTILDDPNRFGSDYRVSYSGIIVGDITKNEVLDGVTEGKTLILFQ